MADHKEWCKVIIIARTAFIETLLILARTTFIETLSSR